MFEYPSQRVQDWLSQRWVMMRGRRVEPGEIDWLMGPFGHVDVIGDRFIQRLAAAEGLTIERRAGSAGLLPSVDAFGLDPDARARLRPEIAAFYERTADYHLEVWTEWNPLFCPFGGLLHWLYSRRLEQLNMPLSPLETARGISSEIIRLRCPASGGVRYTVWHRILKSTGRVIYAGVYSACTTPAGRRCVKVAFPLPRGNATVVMSIRVGPAGELILESSGDGFGGPGFYFLLVDRRGQHWAQFIRSFRERIEVFIDDEGVLRADHVLTLWRCRVMKLHYRMDRRAAAAGEAGVETALNATEAEVNVREGVSTPTA